MGPYYNAFDSAMAQQSTYGNPYSQNQYSRVPVYSPFQNRNNIDDSFSYLANMYGPGLVQSFAGPDAFLAHQTPGQHLADQRAAAQYQQAVVHSVSNANARGNNMVAQKVMGFNALVNGGLPPTQLDREQAQVGAGVFNNPMFKAFAASNLPGGHETLEGLMFGSKGDPGAIASAVGRIGYYRPDAMGGKQMSAEGMQMFSTQLHGQLYGANANVADMRGFGAHATGEMMQELFQQGRLPRSIGSLSAADRVKALSASKRDDQTMQAMAEDFAHHDLTARDYDYANASAEEQKVMLAGKVGGYKSRLENVFQEADKFRNNDPRSKSASEIEQLGGFSMAANAIDAQRTGKVLKEYNGAIAAIRELFGDNGKSNAPVAQLMASLNQLTNGASMQMSPAKVESSMREIRLAARDAGIGDEQLMGMSRVMHHRGMMMGLQAGNVVEQMPHVLSYSNAMDDQGVFAKAGWGKVNKAQAEEKQAALLQRGDASHVGQALAAVNRLATENPDQFKGTELAAMAEAYRKGEETYTYDGQTINLKKVAGMEGVNGIFTRARQSGAGVNQIDAAFNDRIGTQEFLEEGYVYGAQKYQIQQRMGQQTKQFLMGKSSTPEFDKKFKPAGMSDQEFREKTNVLATGFSNSLSDIVMNETADMTAEQRAAHMEKRSKEELSAYFRSKAGGGLSASQADKRAEEYFGAVYGDTPEARRSGMNTAYAEMNAISVARTGSTIATHQQIRGPDVAQQAEADAAVNKKRAERLKAMSSGTETTMVQRLGDELDRLSSGDSGTRAEALARITNVYSTDEMLKKYAPDAQDALAHAGKMYASSTVTAEKIQKLSEAAAANPNGPEQKRLMELAGYKKDHKLTDDEKSSLVSKATMRSIGTAEGATEKDRAANMARQQRADTLFKAFNTGNDSDVRAGATALAQEMLGASASKDAVQAFAAAALSDDPVLLERQIKRLPKEQQEAARSTAAFLRVSKQTGGLERVGLSQSGTSVAEAADRPTARTNAFKTQISSGLKDKLLPEVNSREYRRLRKEQFGDDDERGRVKGEAVAGQLSKILTDVVVDEMGGAENATPEARAGLMEKLGKEGLKKYFIDNDGATPARAEQLAEQHFNALMGADAKTRHKKLDTVFTTTQAEAKRQGLDAESAAKRREAAVAAERASDAAADATITPASDGAGAKYDYKKLGVTDKVTAEQQALIDNIKRNPTADFITAALKDEKSKKLLTTLPDAAAVELFNQFSPEQRKAGLAGLRKAADTPLMMTNLGERYGGPGFNFTKQDQQNFDRLHGVLSNGGKPQTAGVSSNNVMTPAEYAQAQAATQNTAQGGQSNLPAAVTPTSEADILREKMAEIDARAAAAKGTRNWGQQQAAVADESQKKTYTQRLKELESGDPLGSVQQEMAEIQGRKQKGYLWGESFASWSDYSRMSELQGREKAIMAGDGAVVQESAQAGVSAARGAARANQAGATADGVARGSAEAMKVNGTLTLNGLREAILSATGQRMEETPDGGAPVALGPPTGQ